MTERLTPEPLESPKTSETEQAKDYRIKLLEGDQETLLNAINHYIVNRIDQWDDYERSNMDSQKLDYHFLRFYADSDEDYDEYWMSGEDIINVVELLYAISVEKYHFFKTFSREIEDNPSTKARSLNKFFEALRDINEALDNDVQSKRIMKKKRKRMVYVPIL